MVTEEMHAELGDAIPPEMRDVPVVRIRDGNWKITYTLDGVADSFRVHGDATWANDAGLVSGFNALLAKLGRRDRAIKFGKPRGDASSFRAKYIVTDPDSFVPLCHELGIPLALPAT